MSGIVPKTSTRCGTSIDWSSHTCRFMSRIDALRLPTHECARCSTPGPVYVASEPSKSPDSVAQ